MILFLQCSLSFSKFTWISLDFGFCFGLINRSLLFFPEVILFSKNLLKLIEFRGCLFLFNETFKNDWRGVNMRSQNLWLVNSISYFRRQLKDNYFSYCRHENEFVFCKKYFKVLVYHTTICRHLLSVMLFPQFLSSFIRVKLIVFMSRFTLFFLYWWKFIVIVRIIKQTTIL
jgi:hypothetical protein